MKTNPFYGLSAAAMLGGCYLVNHALRLEPGQLGKLLTLIGVLQVYEALLVALGVYLVATRRAPRDGVTVLLLETLFLVDATLLATECVTVDRTVGTLVCFAFMALAAGKLALVRRLLPDSLPLPVAELLGAQVVLVFGLPVAVTHLASARLLGPVPVYGLWWIALALPLARMRILGAVREANAGATLPAVAVWTWVPAASVLLHLWAIGWIHQVPLQPAFLAPILLGFGLTAERESVARQIVLPALAVLVSLGQADALSLTLPIVTDVSVSPLRLAAVGASGVYAILAGRYGYRWLVALSAVFGAAGLLGGWLSGIADATAALRRLVGRLAPGGALGWGVSAIVASFVLLAAGARRSLGGGFGRRPPTRPQERPRGLPGHGGVTGALLAAALAGAMLLSAFGAHPPGHPRQHWALLNAAGLALVAVALGVRAQSQASQSHRDPACQKAATVAVIVGAGALLVSVPGFSLTHGHPHRAESAVLADLRTVLSAQAAYQEKNEGFADADLECLARPSECLPEYPADAPAFLDGSLAAPGERKGYRWSFHPGPPPDEILLRGSDTSVTSYAYVAVPVDPGYTGVRAFCGDSNGAVCFTADGTAPPLAEDGTCDLGACSKLD